jgi:hypothetical protein
MPITDITPFTGEPTQQASGQWRGFAQYTFDDGRKINRRITADTAGEWANKMSDIVPEIEAQMQEGDAAEGVSSDTEITANKQSSIQQRAVAYLRAAMAEDDPYTAFLLLDRFNTFRLAQGWNLDQVPAGLASAGLTAKEWAAMRDAYQYLSDTGRVTAMQAVQDINQTWGDR